MGKMNEEYLIIFIFELVKVKSCSSAAWVCWVEGAEVSLALGGVVTASDSGNVVACYHDHYIRISITVISPSSSGIIHMPPDQMDQPGAAGRLRLREIRDRRIV